MDTSNFKEVFESPKVKALTAQVAALEVEVLRLREALADITDVFSTIGITAGIYDDELAALEKAAKTLSTPFTPTALNELIEKVEKIWREKCARASGDYDAAPWAHDSAALHVADMVSVSIANQIRALPIGQIKLEDLL